MHDKWEFFYQQAMKEDILHFDGPAYNLRHFLQALISNMLRNHLFISQSMSHFHLKILI